MSEAGQSAPLKVGVVGAGAIGGFIAARLAAAGCDVSVLARGATLEAIRSHGLRLQSGGVASVARVKASNDTAELGVQDVVVLAVKSPALPAVAGQLAPLLDERTIVLPALNGVPWWFFQLPSGPLAGRRVRAVDPDGQLQAAIPAAQIVGTVVFPSCYCPEPGSVVHSSGSRLVFGEIDGTLSERAQMLAALFTRAGFEAEASASIRQEVWGKLLGNACFNPVSLLTGSHTDWMIDDERVNRLFQGMMTELQAVGRELGVPLEVAPPARLAFTRKLGHIKTSMLQDMEAGRPVEIDSILGAAVEIAAEVGVPTPLLDSVYAMARLRARILGIYPE